MLTAVLETVINIMMDITINITFARIDISALLFGRSLYACRSAVLYASP
jgi:hypothetical protein